MKTTWKLQDAKAKFSQIVEDALTKSPQFVTRRGREAVVVIAARDYENLISKKPSFKQFLLNGPAMNDSEGIRPVSDIRRRADQ
jgi:antitoxin Phd